MGGWLLNGLAGQIDIGLLCVFGLQHDEEPSRLHGAPCPKLDRATFACYNFVLTLLGCVGGCALAELLSLSSALPRHYEIIRRVLLQLPQWAQVGRGPGQAARPDRLQGPRFLAMWEFAPELQLCPFPPTRAVEARWRQITPNTCMAASGVTNVANHINYLHGRDWG